MEYPQGDKRIGRIFKEIESLPEDQMVLLFIRQVGLILARPDTYLKIVDGDIVVGVEGIYESVVPMTSEPF